jgi:two-component system NtrC family sensor kinase
MRLFLRSASLFFKVIFVTSLILILAISFNVYWNTALHEGSIQRLTQEKTKIIAEFIEKNVIRAMEKGKHFEIHRVLQNFAAYKGIWKIHVFRPDGTIMATTYEGELNRKVENVDFFLKNRSFEKEETLRGKDGKIGREAVFYYVNPIQNNPECYQCHNKKDQVIGVLVVAESMREMHGMIDKVQIHSIILAIITIGFLASVLGLLFLKFVERPITKLTDVMKKVEKGDLGVRVQFKGKDEMGRLAENLNVMIEKLQVAKKEAEQYHQDVIQRANRMASIGELASGMAHEIRNPLAGIQGAIQILAEGFPREDGRRQVTEEIEKQIHKLERLVKNLLNYAKPIPANYIPIDVNGLAEKVLSFFMTQQGGSNNFKVEKNFFSPLPKIMIDPHSMEQAFLNIILNAKKAMPQGGALKVSSRFLSKAGEDGDEVREVQIIFEDTGVGIPRENLGKIFNPFFSTRLDGTGLGLSITRNIIEQHGGRIEVESKVNAGTKFIITLPATKNA